MTFTARRSWRVCAPTWRPVYPCGRRGRQPCGWPRVPHGQHTRAMRGRGARAGVRRAGAWRVPCPHPRIAAPAPVSGTCVRRPRGSMRCMRAPRAHASNTRQVPSCPRTRARAGWRGHPWRAVSSGICQCFCCTPNTMTRSSRAQRSAPALHDDATGTETAIAQGAQDATGAAEEHEAGSLRDEEEGSAHRPGGAWLDVGHCPVRVRP